MIEVFRNRLYRFFIQSATDFCYGNCLEYFPSGSEILDVGIGNGLMINNYHQIIKNKHLKITGIDINRHYLNHCGCLIEQYRLEKNIRIFHEAVELFCPPTPRCYDVILFSMSFMLFSNQQEVLDRVLAWLKPGGRLVFFQTMFRKRSRLMEFIKPKLKYFTTVEFGSVTYDEYFYQFLRRNRLHIIKNHFIKKEWFQGEYRMIAVQPLPCNANAQQHDAHLKKSAFSNRK